MNQITDPLTHISTLFDEYLKTPNSHPVNFDPSAAYLDILKKEKKHIVSLNNISSIHKVPVDSLVRFRCMVQDTGLGQEMFISAYKKQDKNGDMNIHCYRYTDQHIEMPDNQMEMQNEYIAERSLVYCVSPPGENQWTKEAYGSEHDELIKSLDQLNINQPNENALKKYPLPQHQHASAIVKFYNDLGESLRVGQLVEVIGIRGNDVPKNSGDEEEAMLGYGSVLDALAGVPVLHAIAYQNVEADQRLDLQIQNDKSAEDVRKELIEYISSSLNGDVLTAEFILLQLVSRVTTKSQGFKIGNFTLNITGFPNYTHTEQDKNKPLLSLNNPASKSLATILDSLSLHSVHLPLTIDGLNKTKFTPKSVNENLEAGVLQLANGTTLLVDETVLEEGQLVDPGVRNFQALQNVIQSQTLLYEFPFSQFEFDTDIGVISLSHSKSMLPSHCSVRHTSLAATELMHPSKDVLDAYRKFIHEAKYANYDISETVSEYIQNAFVNERKEATSNGTELPNQEDLMLRMNLARLVAVSFGENTLSKERYDYVVDLDNKRKSAFNLNA